MFNSLLLSDFLFKQCLYQKVEEKKKLAKVGLSDALFLIFFGLNVLRVLLLQPFYDIRIHFEENLTPCHF
jgi:hypothetical protein